MADAIDAVIEELNGCLESTKQYHWESPHLGTKAREIIAAYRREVMVEALREALRASENMTKSSLEQHLRYLIATVNCAAEEGPGRG